MVDEATGADERTIMVARKNLYLSADTEPPADAVTLPVARVLREGAGFVFDAAFIPPCVRISASEPLLLLTQRLIETLEQKTADLAAGSRADRKSPFDFSPREIASFWLRHAVNSALGPLRHLWMSKRSHPEELFLEMSRLAGALCTFLLDSHPRDLPPYAHNDLQSSFAALDRHIRKHLDALLPPNCILVPLTRSAEYFYDAEITDPRLFGRSRWILAVASAASTAEVITKTPQLVKFCSARFVTELVKRGLPGLALRHLPTPPPAVTPRLETEYFDVQRSGPCWDDLVKTRRAGVYAPGELPDPQLELLVILEQEGLV
jgi:type VI secretion system protein ImpJ